jgi:hypothetical protein
VTLAHDSARERLRAARARLATIEQEQSGALWERTRLAAGRIVHVEQLYRSGEMPHDDYAAYRARVVAQALDADVPLSHLHDAIRDIRRTPLTRDR